MLVLHIMNILKIVSDCQCWSGEWWNADPITVVRQATRTGAAPNVSDAYTINGQPGDLYNCSSKGWLPNLASNY